jgi:hypothetical protein
MTRLFVLPILCALAAHPALAQQLAQPPQPLAQPPQPPLSALLVPQAPAPAPAPAPPAPAAPRPSRAPQAPPAPAPAPALPAPPAMPFVNVDTTPPQLVNIQLDITIVEEATGADPIRKVVTLTVADREAGSSRSVDRSPGGQGTLNVDVLPNLQKN